MKACTIQVLTKIFASIFIQDKAFEFSGRREHGSMPNNISLSLRLDLAILRK